MHVICVLFTPSVIVNSQQKASIKLKHASVTVAVTIHSCVQCFIIDNLAYTQLTQQITCFHLKQGQIKNFYEPLKN